MIVNRRTFIRKRGQLKKVVELLKEALKRSDFLGAARIYIPEFSDFDVVAVEMEFEDWKQYHKFWEAARGGDPEWWERWFASTENGGANEIWHLA